MLSRELEANGYLNILSEDGKTIIVYACGGNCPTLFIRVDEDHLSVVVPLLADNVNTEELKSLVERILPKTVSLDIYRLYGNVVGLEILYPTQSCQDTACVEEILDFLRSHLVLQELDGKVLLWEADVAL